MRPDMFKVIVERPRTGGGGTRKGRAQDFDDMPSHEGMRRRHVKNYNGKQLNENLAPLRRFIESRVGKPWDKVYSEICKQLNGASTVQQHVKDHVFDFVDDKVVLDAKGKPLMPTGDRAIYRDFWVHPKTGILMKNKVTSRRWSVVHREKEEAERMARERILGSERELHKIDGVWYWAVFADRPAMVITTYRRHDGETVTREHLPSAIDVVTGKNVPAAQKRFRKAKRQASSRDLTRHGLINDPANDDANLPKRQRA